ncbi:hypothetical protein CWE13_03080 [Aliidiomarina shirensis]|uniref:Uncharacterized protein n=1 Tax=Aliidiomarina shirensis TaxID=1048642 RepID=A0A432WXY9_9GAMM|nr:hypothetical protein [Aliidiomarina shirensis]RUO38644.1 hypothetical protein CWE13_03080 [Aliidiomarina shirensis]
MEKSIIYSRNVVFHAAVACYSNMMWIYSVVGAPSIYFGLNGSVFTKVAFFFCGSLILWLPLFLACIFFHGRSLKSNGDIDSFNALTDKEKGLAIGEYIS